MSVGIRDPDYAPYAEGPGGPFRWRLGLRPLDLGEWIEIGVDYAAEMARKREVRASFGDTVFVAMPEAYDACVEVRDAVVDHLAATWPDDFAVRGDRVVNRRLGEEVALDGDDHPLEVAASLVQEDLIVMIDDPASAVPDEMLVFAAGSVCFPNRWDLRSKLGLPLAAVHAPVSRLNEQLGEPIERFFDRLTPHKSFWRTGWGILDTDEPYQPVDGTAAPRPARPRLDDLVVRVERETLRRLPRTGCVLFTIRTYIRRLLDVATGSIDGADDGRRRLDRIAEQVESMPDDVAAYKRLEQIRPLLSDLVTRSERSERPGGSSE